MKKLVVLLFIVTFFSCREDKPGKDKKLEESLLKIKITDNAAIFGNWTMCATSGGGQMIQRNVCPKISFNYNGTGSLGTHGITNENFSWSLKNGTLRISYVNNVPGNNFPDTIYQAIFSTTNKEKQLIIRQEKLDQSFYLGK